MPDFIRKEVAFWCIAYASLGAFLGSVVKGMQNVVQVTPGLLLTIAVGLFVGYAVRRILEGKIGPYWWIPYLVCTVSMAIFYFI